MNQHYTDNADGELERWIIDVREDYVSTDSKTVALVEAISEAEDFADVNLKINDCGGRTPEEMPPLRGKY